MQGTSISNIDYENAENAKIIEEALKETEVLDIEKEQPQQIMPQQQPLQQPFQNPPPQYQPSTQPSPFQQQFQQPMQQQPMQPQPMQPHQQYPQYQQGDFSGIEEKEDIFSSKIFENLRHTLILLILLFLLNNQAFKNIINQLPFTMDEEGDPNIWLTMVLCIIIAFSYCVYLQIFN